jgi:hypothetical protein
MTYGMTKTSIGERRLAGFLRLCDYVIYFGLSSSAFGFVLRNVRVMGLTLVVVSLGAVVKLAGVIVAYLLMSSRTPNADIAPWIRRWARTASALAVLAALWAVIAAHDPATRLLGSVIALLSLLLFRRVGSLAIGELDAGWGSSESRQMFFFRGVFGPEIDALLAGAWLVLAIVVRVSMPSLFRPSEQTVHSDQLKMRVLAVVNAESRYRRAHGSYSDDIAELRRLGSTLIDSLVVVTVDARSYRAIATDPGGRVSCGLWSAARIGEQTPLQIEGAAANQLVCWTAPDSAKKAR